MGFTKEQREYIEKVEAAALARADALGEQFNEVDFFCGAMVNLTDGEGNVNAPADWVIGPLFGTSVVAKLREARKRAREEEARLRLDDRAKIARLAEKLASVNVMIASDIVGALADCFNIRLLPSRKHDYVDGYSAAWEAIEELDIDRHDRDYDDIAAHIYKAVTKDATLAWKSAETGRYWRANING